MSSSSLPSPFDTWYRSSDDKMIAGVCGGIAHRYGLDPALVRFGVVALALLTNISMATLILYGVAWYFLPEQNTK
ncbi:PspC domain-containing protein [Corynebacterium sp. 13CS0277]|uniref:PspC domain-containing protein n=1 Tax=Corynebacterium sp. 13CS0277 TaxID=2071994 RepID=UPI000D036BB2|nr:PspC domain-containing protein [Corynebacterium sp. 13CS0277]PRQ11351.1 PspC domain-containing protein [Corynebacterium sp. 13CS0277]